MDEWISAMGERETAAGNLPLTKKSGNLLIGFIIRIYIYRDSSQTFIRAVLFDSGKALPNDENYADFHDQDRTPWTLGQEGILFFRPLAHTIGWLNGFPRADPDLSKPGGHSPTCTIRPVMREKHCGRS